VTAVPAPFADPALAEIAVEAPAPADEKLFLDAYEKAVSGEPEDARALLEKYLASFPDGRYWQRVAEILGEE
jgi:TolA-binding protein